MITIAEFQKLLNNQCSVQEYKRIQQEIDCRFSYIVRKLEKQLNWNVIWFDYKKCKKEKKITIKPQMNERQVSQRRRHDERTLPTIKHPQILLT